MEILFLALVAFFYIACNFFIWSRSVHWFHKLHSFLHRRWFTILFTAVYVIFAASPALCMLFKGGEAEAAARHITNIWIGFFIYALFFMVLSFLVTLIVKRVKKMGKESPGWRTFIVIRGIAVAACIFGISAYGMFHAGEIKTAEYSVSIDKPCAAGDELTVVLAADMHMGYSVGEKQIEKMVEAINRQNPDLVCLAGDIFDNNYAAVQNPDRMIHLYRSIKSKYGVYACYGNHDVAEKLIGGFTLPSDESPVNEKEMYEFLDRAGVRLLEDESLLIEDAFYLIGRRDYSKPGTKMGGRASIESLTEGMDENKPILLMDHQPKELQADADAGVDAVFSGHTHDGQIFPGNLLLPLFWENACGYLEKEDLHSIVTSGVGVWGPAMRVGTDSEVAVIHISFADREQEH